MARSTDTKRRAAKAEMPAKRSPARRKPAAAPRLQRPEERATPTGRNGAGAAESTGAPAPEAVGEPVPVPMPKPEAAAAPLAVSGGEAEPAASPDAQPEVRPGPEPEARTEEVPSAPEAPAEVASAAPALAALEEVAAVAAAPALRRTLFEGTIDLHGQMVAFACRQTEFGLAAGRAILASRSLPEVVSLQSAFVARSVENALAHTLELTRLSAEMLRQGLRSGSTR